MRQLVITSIPNVHHGFHGLQRYRLATKTLRALTVTGFYPDFVAAEGYINYPQLSNTSGFANNDLNRIISQQG